MLNVPTFLTNLAHDLATNYGNIARLEFLQGNMSAAQLAVEAAERNAARVGHDASALELRGALAFRMGNSDLARASWNKALAVSVRSGHLRRVETTTSNLHRLGAPAI